MRVHVTDGRCEIRGSRLTAAYVIVSALQLVLLVLEIVDPDRDVLLLVLRAVLMTAFVLAAVNEARTCLTIDEAGVHYRDFLQRRDTPWQVVTRITRDTAWGGLHDVLRLHRKEDRPIAMEDDADCLRLIRQYTGLSVDGE